MHLPPPAANDETKGRGEEQNSPIYLSHDLSSEIRTLCVRIILLLVQGTHAETPDAAVHFSHPLGRESLPRRRDVDGVAARKKQDVSNLQKSGIHGGSMDEYSLVEYVIWRLGICED